VAAAVTMRGGRCGGAEEGDCESRQCETGEDGFVGGMCEGRRCKKSMAEGVEVG
jgi:hypothetical protein